MKDILLLFGLPTLAVILVMIFALWYTAQPYTARVVTVVTDGGTTFYCLQVRGQSQVFNCKEKGGE